MSIATISPQQLHERVRAGESLELIDVRTPVEYREVHIPFAKNVPLDQLSRNPLAATQPSEQPMYLVCRSGSRGQQACEKLISAGYTNVVNVQGGTQAWDQAGLPVVRGKKSVSLERQVRIAAGSLVLIGAVLAVFVHPYFIALAGFVGAGLVFAGLTDTCGMGMLLARMPWNRVSTTADAEGAGSEQACGTATKPSCCG